MTDEEWIDLYWDQFEEDGDKKEKQDDKEDKNEEETAKEEEKETVKEEEKETAKEEEKEIAAKANEEKPAENELAVPEPSKSAKRRMNFQEKYRSKKQHAAKRSKTRPNVTEKEVGNLAKNLAEYCNSGKMHITLKKLETNIY
jgi:hypothetical protein